MEPTAAQSTAASASLAASAPLSDSPPPREAPRLKWPTQPAAQRRAAAGRSGARRTTGLILPLALLSAWHLCTAGLHLFAAHQLPSPGQVLAAARELWASGELLRHLRASCLRVSLGFGFGATGAVAVGALVGLSRPVERTLDPTLQAIRNVPSLAWVPLLLLWLGIDELPKVTLIAIGSFFPVYLATVAGVRQVDRRLVEVGYVFGLGPAELVRRILLPAALPQVLTGLRVGAGQAWLFLTAAELIASTRGLGFLLIDGQNSMRPDSMLVAILSLALLGKLTDSVLRGIERRALGWADTLEQAGETATRAPGRA